MGRYKIQESSWRENSKDWPNHLTVEIVKLSHKIFFSSYHVTVCTTHSRQQLQMVGRQCTHTVVWKNFKFCRVLGLDQSDLTMGVCFSRFSQLLSAVVQLLLWGRVNSFSRKIFDFCRQLPEMAFFNNFFLFFCENESTLIYMPHKSSRSAAAKSKQI